MRGRVLLISVVLNVMLAVSCLLIWRAHCAAVTARSRDTNSLVLIATNKLIPVYRKQFFTWNEIETPDYQQYITNLRNIACPEQTIRDIITADVNQLYARKRQTDIPDPYEQWWRTESDADFAKTLAQKTKALDDERRLLLARLLGADWERNKETVRTRDYLRLEGEVLGNLTPEARRAVQDIVDQSQRVLASLRIGGKTVSPADQVKVEQDLRTQLAAVLSPQQLEEFNLRYSANAQNLRSDLGQLKFFKTTPDEFRNLFRATDGLDLKIRMLGDATEPAAQQELQGLKQQRETAVKNTVGPERYAEYVRLQDPAYRDAMATATNSAGGTLPQSAGLIYRINQESAVERELVLLDPNLTESQRAIEMLKIQLEQVKAQSQARGETLPPETSAQPPAPPTAVVPRPYTVSSGENLNTLAQKLNVSPGQIQAANPGVNLKAIPPGQTITIPTLEPVAQPPAQ